MLQQPLRIERNRSPQLCDGLCVAAMLAQPVPIVSVRPIVIRRQHNRAQKVPFGLSRTSPLASIRHRPVDDSEVDLERRIVGREDQRPVEQVERRRIPSLVHLRQPVDHQPATVVRRLLDIVLPQRRLIVPHRIASMRSIPISRQHQHRDGTQHRSQLADVFLSHKTLQ
jgi:hypothetical protein